MNRKGFTLVELLATIFILSIVMGIASMGVISYINTSRKSSEKIFVDKLSSSIESYLNLNGSKLTRVNSSITYTFTKCKSSPCNSSNSYSATAYQLSSFYLKDLVSANVLEEEKILNPANKEKCLNNDKNPQVIIYKDSDYVYYYYVDLSGTNTSCEISEDNDLINTLPDSLVQSLVSAGVSLPTRLVNQVNGS